MKDYWRVSFSADADQEQEGVLSMINFEEELARFKPSKEVEQAEDVIMNTNLRDMTDIMQEILKEKEQQ